MRRLYFLPLFLVLLLFAPLSAVGEEAANYDKPFFLVASDQMPDPIFQESVILMLPASPDQPIIAGLIVNKPTRVALDEFFHQLPGLKHQEQVAYFGGPVDDNLPMMIMKQPQASIHPQRLMNDLYVTAGIGSITSVVTHEWSPKETRIFFGRAQWSRDQLRMEIIRGAWSIEPVRTDLIFSADGKAVWRSLYKHSGLREVLDPDVMLVGERSSITGR